MNLQTSHILINLVSPHFRGTVIHKYWSLSLRFSMDVSDFEYIIHCFKITSENNECNTWISVCWCLLVSFLCSPKFRGFFVWGFSFCHLRGWRVLQNLSWSSVHILVSVKVCASCNLGWNSASGSPSWAEMQTNRIFCIDMQILQRNGCLSELPLCCCWGSGGWKNELCVHKAAGTRVSPKCLCLGICKAINVSFFCFSC